MNKNNNNITKSKKMNQTKVPLPGTTKILYQLYADSKSKL